MDSGQAAAPKSNGERPAKKQSKLLYIWSFPDFRLLWIGAFLSFTGSWIQRVAEGYFVYLITRDESKLALVSFVSSMPVFVLGLAAGSVADMFDKRRMLVITQALYAAGAIYLAIATEFKFVQYWQIVAVAFLLGVVSCIEMPTRQSVLSRVVPPEVLAAAVPVQAMTFNVARIFGPAIGGFLLAWMGVPACYMLNGISFLALIWAALAIKSDLSAPAREPQPIRDLVLEGMRYTFMDLRLRTLFILESLTATFGLFYIALMPAYVKEVMLARQEAIQHLSSTAVDLLEKQTLGYSFAAVGVGALGGLLVATHIADGPHKAVLIRAAMWAMGFGLVAMSFVTGPLMAYPLLAVLGAASIVQFNTTNALFQTLSPDRLRGRVLSMHIWALNGLSPFGVLLFGKLAQSTRENGALCLGSLTISTPSTGVALAMQVGGSIVLLGAIAATAVRGGLAGLSPLPPVPSKMSS